MLCGRSVLQTRAQIIIPSVTSGSSPLSLTIPQDAAVSDTSALRTARSSAIPPGVSRCTEAIGSPEKSISAADFAAAAAQAPVV